MVHIDSFENVCPIIRRIGRWRATPMTIVSKTNNAKWLHLLIFTSVDVDGATLVLLLFASFRLCLVYCRRRHHRRRRYNGTKRHWRKKSRCSDTMSARFDDHQFGERCPISGGRGTYHYTLILFHSFSLSHSLTSPFLIGIDARQQ